MAEEKGIPKEREFHFWTTIFGSKMSKERSWLIVL